MSDSEDEAPAWASAMGGMDMGGMGGMGGVGGFAGFARPGSGFDGGGFSNPLAAADTDSDDDDDDHVNENHNNNPGGHMQRPGSTPETKDNADADGGSDEDDSEDETPAWALGMGMDVGRPGSPGGSGTGFGMLGLPMTAGGGGGVIGIDLAAAAAVGMDDDDDASSSGSDSDDYEHDKVWAKGVAFDEEELPMIDLDAELVGDEPPGEWRQRRRQATKHWRRLEKAKRARLEERRERLQAEERAIRKAHAQARYDSMLAQKRERRQLISEARKQSSRRQQQEREALASSSADSSGAAGADSDDERQLLSDDDDPDGDDDDDDDDDDDSDVEGADPELLDAVAQIDERLLAEQLEREAKLDADRERQLAELAQRQADEEAQLEQEWLRKQQESGLLPRRAADDSEPWDISSEDDEDASPPPAADTSSAAAETDAPSSGPPPPPSSSSPTTSSGLTRSPSSGRLRAPSTFATDTRGLQSTDPAATAASSASPGLSRSPTFTSNATELAALNPELQDLQLQRQQAVLADQAWLRKGLSGATVDLYRPELAAGSAAGETGSGSQPGVPREAVAYVLRVLVPGAVFGGEGNDATITLKALDSATTAELVAQVVQKLRQKGLATAVDPKQLRVVHPQASLADWVLPRDLSLREALAGLRAVSAGGFLNLLLVHHKASAATTGSPSFAAGSGAGGVSDGGNNSSSSGLAAADAAAGDAGAAAGIRMKVSSLREGPMLKVGGFRRQAKRRWFVLLPDCLQYYRSHTDPGTLAGTVFLTPESRVTAPGPKEDPASFVFTPYPGGRQYLLTAQSWTDRVHWSWALETAIADCKLRAKRFAASGSAGASAAASGAAAGGGAGAGGPSYTCVKGIRLGWEPLPEDPQGLLVWSWEAAAGSSSGSAAAGTGSGTDGAVRGSLALKEVSDIILGDRLSSFDLKAAGLDSGARLVTVLGKGSGGRGVQLNLVLDTPDRATQVFRALRRILALGQGPILANESATRITVLSNVDVVRQALLRAARSGERLMGGLLWKQGGRWKNWKARYFLTQPGGDAICYYELQDAEDNVLKRQGTIPLFGAHIEALGAAEAGGDRPNCFVIKPAGAKRSYLLQAASEGDRQGWLGFLRQLQAASGMEAASIGLASPGASSSTTGADPSARTALHAARPATLRFGRPPSSLSQTASGTSPHSSGSSVEAPLPLAAGSASAAVLPGSQAAQLPAASQVLIQGELEKLAGTSGLWRARFFQLQAADPGHLHYYQVKQHLPQQQPGSQPQAADAGLLSYARTGSIPLRGAHVEAAPAKGERCLTVTPYGSRRAFMLRAPSAAMRDRWVETLVGHVQRLQEDGSAALVGSLTPNELGHLMTGFLMKRGGGTFNSTFKERYFVLTRDALMYFKKSNAAKPSGAILLGGAKLEEINDPKVKFGFSITPAMGKRSYILSASEGAARQAWLDMLQKVIDKC